MYTGFASWLWPSPLTGIHNNVHTETRVLCPHKAPRSFRQKRPRTEHSPHARRRTCQTDQVESPPSEGGELLVYMHCHVNHIATMVRDLRVRQGQMSWLAQQKGSSVGALACVPGPCVHAHGCTGRVPMPMRVLAHGAMPERPVVSEDTVPGSTSATWRSDSWSCKI